MYNFQCYFILFLFVTLHVFVTTTALYVIAYLLEPDVNDQWILGLCTHSDAGSSTFRCYVYCVYETLIISQPYFRLSCDSIDRSFWKTSGGRKGESVLPPSEWTLRCLVGCSLLWVSESNAAALGVSTEIWVWCKMRYTTIQKFKMWKKNNNNNNS